jgi:hypothetical protein
VVVTPDELALYLGVDQIDDGRARMFLEAAEAEVAAYCNRVGLTQTTDTIDLRGAYGPLLELPRGPVASVESVFLDGTEITDFEVLNDTLYRGSNMGIYTKTTSASWGSATSVVTVTYTHGFVDPPAVIHSAVLNLASRSYAIGERPGVTSESMGSLSVSYGSTGASTQDVYKTLLPFHYSQTTSSFS